MPGVGTPPTVSIVLPTYNRSDILRQSIQSLLNQTYDDFELIVVDDGSTDDTQDVVSSIGDSRIRYIKHEINQGASAARNTGINEARGEIIAFQDSDDEWFPEKLSKQMERFQNSPSDVGVVYTGMWRIVNGDKRYLPYSGVEHKKGDISDSIMRINFISTQMAAVRRECFNKVGTFDEDLPALVDWELWIRLSKHYHFKLVDEPLIEAAVQSDSISKNQTGNVRAREKIVDKHYDRFDADSLANHLFYIGHGSMKLGQAEKGRKYLTRAVRTKPRPLYLATWLLSLSGQKVYTTIYQTVKNPRGALST